MPAGGSEDQPGLRRETPRAGEQYKITWTLGGKEIEGAANRTMLVASETGLYEDGRDEDMAQTAMFLACNEYAYGQVSSLLAVYSVRLS